MKTIPFKIDAPKEAIDMGVKKVTIKRNTWDNYGLFVGAKKIKDAAYKNDLIDYAKERYPSAEIIDKCLE